MKITSSLLSFFVVRQQSSAATVSTRTSAFSDDLQAKRLKKMAEALQQIQSLPTPQQAAKDAAKERIALLKQRIDSLKALLLHATPAQAKALASELKSIASQLGSIAKQMGAGSSGPSVVSTTVAGVNASLSSSASASASAAASTTTASGASESGSASASAAASSASSAADQAGNHAGTQESTQDGTQAGSSGAAKSPTDHKSETSENKPSSFSLKRAGTGNAASSDDDSSLRQLLHEAKKSLKEAANMLRSKLAEKDKEGQHDLRAIDKSIAEIEAVESNSSSSGSLDGGSMLSAVSLVNASVGMYSNLGGLVADVGGAGGSGVAVGLTINVSG